VECSAIVIWNSLFTAPNFSHLNSLPAESATRNWPASKWTRSVLHSYIDFQHQPGTYKQILNTTMRSPSVIVWFTFYSYLKMKRGYHEVTQMIAATISPFFKPKFDLSTAFRRRNLVEKLSIYVASSQPLFDVDLCLRYCWSLADFLLDRNSTKNRRQNFVK